MGQALLVVLITLPLAIIAGECGAYAELVLPSFIRETFLDFSQQPFLLVFLTACVMPAVGEEIFFRGFLGRGLIARYGLWIGGLLGAFLFGVMHVDPVQGTSAFFLGAALQGVFVATKSLFAPMLLHLLNNTLGFALMRHPDFPGAVDHAPPLVAASAIAALVAICVLIRQTRSRWICPNGEVWSPGYATTESPPAGVTAERRTGRPSILAVLIAAAAYAALLAAIASANDWL